MKERAKHPILTTAACFIFLFTLCGFGYVISIYWGAGSADGISFANLTQPFGTINNAHGSITEVDDNAWERSDIIVDYTNIFADNSVCYILDNGNIPALYFSPAYMVIFAQENNTGWTLDAGEKIAFALSLNDKQSIELEIGYVFNGEYHELSTAKGHDFSETLQAAENGEYYICITNRSSINAVIVNGSIKNIEKQEQH